MAAAFAAARTWFVVVTLTAVGASAAAGYGLTAPKRYRATAQIIVSPVSAADETFTGLNVLREPSGRHTAAQSVAVLVRSPQVADAVRAQLGVRQSSAGLLHELTTAVVGTSDVVDVTVEDSSAASSAQLANAFVDALIAQRNASFQSQLASATRRDAELLAGRSAGPQAVELARRLAVLRSFQGQPDPTLRRASTATAPASASWPDVPALVATGAGAGLAAAALIMLAVTLFHSRRLRVARDEHDVSGPAAAQDAVAESLVDRLDRRLQARESALAARERDLQAKIEELRSLGGGADGGALAERERQLAERVDLVTRRELEVARRAAASAPQDDGLAEREAALAGRERQLEERIAAVTQRELMLARRAAAPSPRDPALEEREAALAEREREIEERAQQLEKRTAAVTEREVEAEARPAAMPVPEQAAVAPRPPAEAGPEGAFNLSELERLVEERGHRFPERRDEWQSYLFFLRDYAEPDGTLPASFDWLIHDTFRELLV